MDAPKVGQRITYDGIEYVVNRVTGGKTSTGKPMRLQIDAMSVKECVQRRDNLDALLRGEAAVDSE